MLTRSDAFVYLQHGMTEHSYHASLHCFVWSIYFLPRAVAVQSISKFLLSTVSSGALVGDG